MTSRALPFVLFGPPAIGKSTLIDALSIAGYATFDAEALPRDVSRNASTASHLCTEGHEFIGANGIPPSDWRGGFLVLLALPRVAYDERRRERDAAVPKKARQVDVYDGFMRDTTVFDATVDASGSVDDVVRRLVDLRARHLRGAS
jgi:hypothetical protein